jgi:hypothetical protein
MEISLFLADLTALQEKRASKCDKLDVLMVELTELKSRPTLLGACTSCPVLHEKLVESCSHIVSLEAELKSPIATSCSTCELHVVKNLELAHYVDRLQDENDELRKCLSWLSGQEPQLGIMIATFSAMMVKHLGLTKLERVVVREMRKLEKFLSHHIQHRRTSLSLSLTI